MTQGSSFLATLALGRNPVGILGPCEGVAAKQRRGSFACEMRDENWVNDSDARNKEATQKIFHYPSLTASQCENVTANNPKGIATSSPRLASNAYLGCASGNGNNANGVAAKVMPAVRNGLAITALRLGRFDGR